MPNLQARRRSPRSPFASGPIAPMLGDWALLDTLYEGRFATVARVVPRRCDDEGERGYVAKIARSEGVTPLRCGNLLRREMDLLNGLDHPHVVTVLDADGDHSSPYFVMPLVGERTLADWIQHHQRLTLSEILWVGRQVAEGIGYLHRLDLCHLDIKPENVVVSESGHATLIDLGFAQATGVHGSSAPIVGSRDYIAPERFRMSRVVTPSADIYSLGVLMVALLCGSPDPSHLCEADSDTEGKQRVSIRQARRSYIQARHPGLPFRFIEFVESMIASIPERRPLSDGVLETFWRTEIESFQI